MKSKDPTHIPLLENIREFLKGTIFAHPDDVKEAVKATTPKSKEVKKPKGR